MNKSSLHSAGGASVALAAMPAMPRSVFDTSNEGDAPLQPVRRCPSNDAVDIVPQPPIRRESSSLQSHSLFDLDPRDSIPKLPRRKSSDKRPDSTHGRRKVRTRDEQSSSGSSLMRPPSSVLVPQDSSLWSQAISTLMSHDDDDRGAASQPKQPDFDAALVPKEMLPWDRIAIGVVCEKRKIRTSMQPPPRSDIDFNISILDDLESHDTMSYPSFHQVLTSNGDSQPESAQYSHRWDIASSHEPRSSGSRLQSPPGRVQTGRACIDRFGSSPTISPAAQSPLLKPCRTPSQERIVSSRDSSRHSSQETPPCYRLDDSNSEVLVAIPPFGHRSSSTLRASTSTTFHSRDVPNQRDEFPVFDRLDETQSGPLSTCSPLQDITIEIAPGISLPLRGSEETWKAIAEGQATVTTCISCQQELHCVLDAQLVVCPDCTMLSPVDQTHDYSGTSADRYGVGLGVKPVDVLRWLERNP